MDQLKGGLQNFQMIPPSNLKIIKRIGFGSVGDVYLSTWNETVEVAVKMIKIPPEFLDLDSLSGFSDEIKTLGELRHPNVVQMLGASVTEDNIYLVMEYVPQGSVCDQLKRNPNLQVKEILQIAIDTASGLNYLHKRNPVMIHRDLKPHNLLITNAGVTKITDFGSAALFEPGKTLSFSVGTPQYMAPEVIKRERYTEKVDVYSYGVVLWELIMGEPPYGHLDPYDVLKGILTGELNGYLCKSLPHPDFPRLSNLVESCLEFVPNKRPSFDSIVIQLIDISQEYDCPITTRTGKKTQAYSL